MAPRGNCVGFIKTARECLKGIVITSQFNIAEKITCIVFDSQTLVSKIVKAQKAILFREKRKKSAKPKKGLTPLISTLRFSLQ